MYSYNIITTLHVLGRGMVITTIPLSARRDRAVAQIRISVGRIHFLEIEPQGFATRYSRILLEQSECGPGIVPITTWRRKYRYAFITGIVVQLLFSSPNTGH
jgi:hypothetical protein